jgi:hypothetical protein
MAASRKLIVSSSTKQRKRESRWQIGKEQRRDITGRYVIKEAIMSPMQARASLTTT